MPVDGGEKIDYLPVAAVGQKCVIPLVDQYRSGNGFYVGKIHHHTLVRRAAAGDHVGIDCDFYRIAMPVQMPTLAVVVRQSVSGVEFEAAGNLHGWENLFAWVTGLIISFAPALN